MLRSLHHRFSGIITNASVRYVGSASRAALSIAPSNSNLQTLLTQKGCANNNNVHLAAGTIQHTRSFHQSTLYQKADGDDVYVTKTEQSTSSKNGNNAQSSSDNDSSTSGSTCSQGIPNDIDDEEEEQEEMFVTADPVLGVGIIQEWGGPRRGGSLAEPTRFGDWERKGRCTDF